MTISDETRAYLGGYGTEAQQQLFQDASQRIQEIFLAQHPDSPEDMPVMISGELSGAAQYVLGDSTLEELGSAATSAYATYLALMDEVAGAMIAAEAAGLTITEISRATGLTRQTVYKRLGRAS